jgi:hypothetical protein
MSIACVASECTLHSVYLGGGDAERARTRLLRGSKTAGCNWRRDFRKDVFPRVRSYPPLFDLWEKGVHKLFFRKPPRHCAALVHIVSEGACMPNRSRLGACTAVEAATIVHDVHYVT